MSAWGEERGGPLSERDVDDLVTLIRSWQSEPNQSVDQTVAGVATRGEPYYEIECAECHGAKGEGGDFMSLNNPEFLKTASDGFLRRAIAKGRAGTQMKGYDEELTPQTIDDLVVLIRSWAVDPKNDPIGKPPDQLGDIVLNAGGAEPDFGSERFVAADAVKSALDSGARFGFLDARPWSDYVGEHISGAVSVPFFSVEKYRDQLPRDAWLVAYCGCPHAESGLLADALEKEGFTKVRVLDEGFFVWKERGYPTTTGEKP